MPKEIYKKQLCVDDIRHSEYYDLQSTFDELYAKSANGGIFMQRSSGSSCRES